MVGYCLRYLESLIFFKEILSSCKFGKIRSAQISFSQHLSLWRKNLNYEDSVSAKKQLGGGILLEMSHELDYIQWIFGNIKKGVGYSHQVKDLKMNVPNHADFIIKTTKNILVNIHMDMLSEIPQRRCKVLCENGTVLWDYNKNLVKWKINGQNVREKKFSKKEKNQMYETEIKNFIEIITKKKKAYKLKKFY